MKVFIVNPDNNELCSVELWKKEKNPARAKYVVLELDNGERRMYYKNKLRTPAGECDMHWNTALELAAAFREDGLEGWKLESRREALDCAGDAWNIFPEAVDLIGGDIIRDWFWTCEAFQSTSYAAWIFGGSNGNLNFSHTRVNAYPARVFRAL